MDKILHQTDTSPAGQPTIKELADQCQKLATQLRRSLDLMAEFLSGQPLESEQPNEMRDDLRSELSGTLHILQVAAHGALELQIVLGSRTQTQAVEGPPLQYINPAECLRRG